ALILLGHSGLRPGGPRLLLRRRGGERTLPGASRWIGLRRLGRGRGGAAARRDPAGLEGRPILVIDLRQTNRELDAIERVDLRGVLLRRPAQLVARLDVVQAHAGQRAGEVVEVGVLLERLALAETGKLQRVVGLGPLRRIAGLAGALDLDPS